MDNEEIPITFVFTKVSSDMEVPIPEKPTSKKEQIDEESDKEDEELDDLLDDI